MSMFTDKDPLFGVLLNMREERWKERATRYAVEANRVIAVIRRGVE